MFPSLPSQLGPEHIIHRVSSTEIQSLARLYRFLEPGALLHGGVDTEHAVFSRFWSEARADTFAPTAAAVRLQASKER